MQGGTVIFVHSLTCQNTASLHGL